MLENWVGIRIRLDLAARYRLMTHFSQGEWSAGPAILLYRRAVGCNASVYGLAVAESRDVIQSEHH